MEQSKTKHAKNRIRFFKVATETRSKYYARWFANAKEVNARSDLQLLYDDALRKDHPFYGEAEVALNEYAVYGIMTIGTILSDGFDLNRTYYVAYTESDVDLLEMAILYSIEAKTAILNVNYMVISSQGVLHEINEHHKSRTRPRIHELFQGSMCAIRAKNPDVRYISITIATKGSLSAIKHLWPEEDTTGVTDNNTSYQFDMSHVCATCDSPDVQYYLTGVGAHFCGTQCARDFWKHLERMEHPLTDLLFFAA